MNTAYDELCGELRKQPANVADHRRRRLHRLQPARNPAQARSARGRAGQLRHRLPAQPGRGASTWSARAVGELQLHRGRHPRPGRLPAAPATGVDYVLHQAALGSVPRSLEDPITTNDTNITGFLNMLVAARDAKVKRFVYAASSSTYGDHPGLPKVEDIIGKPLSPYAVTKFVNELYADVFARSYGFETIGLRYFNVFGPRQDPNGAYAAVIPKWIGRA